MTDEETMKFINSNTELLSILYDADLLPEQLIKGMPKWDAMIKICLWYKSYIETGGQP